MKLPTHTKNAVAITAKIQSLGISLLVQQKIGTFAIVWGMFESHLERAVWCLQNEKIEGKRPSTDKTSAHTWIDVLSNGRSDLDSEANAVLHCAAKAAKDLMSYRHSLFHGYLVPLGGTAMFIRNPTWHGEIRNREAGDAHIDENIIDLAIDAAWVLFRVVIAVTKLEDKFCTSEIEQLANEVNRIRNNANEVRHLSYLYNQEKY
ncbi:MULTISPECIES: hypothetical protein [Vibrio]|nr:MULTISPECIES: hypothetical protein [Vibrio]EGR0730466.1 hypothetical protein [Vibrio cholerae]EGR0786750.1 hypothetical protein [Vibrio cholerae]EGR0836806.1 hypothetical protein [Vibrio cholerae]EGR0845243.1 hypothetical protein [Vibrio cholerae]EGR0862544.1 hypothetical protein [Vibrio cholerae]